MENKKKILIVDDHKIIRDGLRLILDSDGGYEVLEASSGKQALHMIAGNKIDLTMSDISMEPMSGIELCKEIKKNWPDHKIMVLTMNKESSLVQEMLEIGVNGFVFKESGRNEILGGVTTILEGEYYFSQDVATKMTLLHTREQKAENKVVQLTEREEEVLRLISEEYTNKEIGDQLFISVRTVDSHRRNLIEKIGARNTAGLVRYAFMHKLTG